MITANQRRPKSRRPDSRARLMRLAQLLFIGFLGWSFVACDQGQRFKVPASYRRMKQRAVQTYRPQGKIPVPKAQTLPLWSEMVDLSTSGVFRSELVTLKGVRWSRESSSKIYDIYFRSDNHMAARTLVQVADQLAFFVTRWFGRPFPGRVSVVLMPMSAPPKPPKKAATPSPTPARTPPEARSSAPKAPKAPAPKQPAPTLKRPAAAPQAPQAPTSQPTSRPVAKRPTTAPTSRPTSQPAVDARPAPRAREKQPARKLPAARPVPARRAQRAAPQAVARKEPAPPRRRAPAASPAKRTELAVPEVGARRIVIYTGTTNNPVYSRYGLISALLSRTIRVFLTGNATPSRQAFWRSVVTPAYFALRGTGAMVDRSYDKTATPTLRNILRRLGRPTIAEVQRSIKAYRKGTLPKLLRGQAEHLAMSMLGFLEDAYGRGVLAAILRHQLTTPKASFGASATAVIGQPAGSLWRQWFHYYYKDLWRDVIRGRAKLRDLPLAPSRRRAAPPAGRRP